MQGKQGKRNSTRPTSVIMPLEEWNRWKIVVTQLFNRMKIMATKETIGPTRSQDQIRNGGIDMWKRMIHSFCRHLLRQFMEKNSRIEDDLPKIKRDIQCRIWQIPLQYRAKSSLLGAICIPPGPGYPIREDGDIEEMKTTKDKSDQTHIKKEGEQGREIENGPLDTLRWTLRNWFKHKKHARPAAMAVHQLHRDIEAWRTTEKWNVRVEIGDNCWQTGPEAKGTIAISLNLFTKPGKQSQMGWQILNQSNDKKRRYTMMEAVIEDWNSVNSTNKEKDEQWHEENAPEQESKVMVKREREEDTPGQDEGTAKERKLTQDGSAPKTGKRNTRPNDEGSDPKATIHGHTGSQRAP